MSRIAEKTQNYMHPSFCLFAGAAEGDRDVWSCEGDLDVPGVRLAPFLGLLCGERRNWILPLRSDQERNVHRLTEQSESFYLFDHLILFDHCIE